MKYYKTSSEIYTATRLALDTLWGHPKVMIHQKTGIEVRTTSCLPDLDKILKDKDGNVIVSLPDSMANWPEVKTKIDSLIQLQAIEELTEQEYKSIWHLTKYKF